MTKRIDGRSLAIAAAASEAVTNEIAATGGDIREVRRALTWTLCMLAASEDAAIDEIVAEFRTQLEAERNARLGVQGAN